MLFYTNSSKHLVEKIRVRKGKFITKKFGDGEIYVKINENVKNKKVWVLANTITPEDNLMELMFLLNALKALGAKVNVIFSYFSYARQDRIVEKGESLSSKLICDWLKGFGIGKIFIFHIHSNRIKKFLKFESVIPHNLFGKIIKKFDILVAPDTGALENVKALAKKFNKEYFALKKVRPAHEKVKIVSGSYDVESKRVLIVDDMISSGSTIIAAAKKLKNAKEISALATHGLFRKNSKTRLLQNLKKIYVSNSLIQKKSKGVEIIDISKHIEKIIKTN